MPKILVTGGAGFVAGSLARRLVQDPNNYVVIIDNLLTGNRSRLPSREYSNWKFIKGDVNNFKDISSIMISYSFDYVFHYAAVVGVQRTLEEPVMVLQDIDGIKNILHLAKNTGVKRVLYASSSEVYGESVSFPQDEHNTPLNSRLPYAVVKNVGEAFCKSYQQEYGLDCTVFRFFNTYGPMQSSDFVVSRFIKKALRNEDISIYGDGLQSRTFCYIDDNIDTTLACLYEEKYINDVLNIGSAVETSVLDLAQKIIKVTGSKSVLKHVPALEEGDMKRRMPDNARMKEILQRPLVSLEEGLKRVVEAKTLQLKNS